MKKLFIILVFFISSCGYEPLYQNKKIETLNFNQIKMNGDTEINKKIISSLNISKNSSSNKVLILNSRYAIEKTSKDSKGQVDTLRTKCNVTITIEENGKILKSKSFDGIFTYNNLENKFDLLNYQNEIKKNMINKIIEDIIIYLTL